MAFLPTISTVFIIISAILVILGWRFIIKEKKQAHKRAMILAAISALLFLITYVSRTIMLGNTSFGGPDDVKIYYTIFLLFHITLSVVGFVFGVVTLRLAFKRKIDKHQKLGPITSIIWLISAITGVMVYLFLYIFYSGGEVTSMLKAIFGI